MEDKKICWRKLKGCNTVNNRNTIKKLPKVCTPSFHKKCDLIMSTKIRGINSTPIPSKVWKAVKSNLTQNWENKKSNCFLEKLIHNITQTYPSNHRQSLCNKLRVYHLVCWVPEGTWFHIQREDGANTSSLWSPQRNCYCLNDTL